MTDLNQPLTTAEADAEQPGRGRDAGRPMAIPTKGWKDIAWRLKSEISSDNVGLIAAGIAFYGLLAIFPAITALMALAGLLYQPEELVAALEGVGKVVPPDVSEILLTQAQSVAGGQDAGLTFGLILGIALALWSASAGVGSLIQGLNVAYDEQETRGFIRLKLMTLAMTISMILGVLIAAMLIIVVPIVLAFVTIAPGMETLVQILAYVPMALIFVSGVVILYRWGPDRSPAKLRWLTPGAIAASLLWVVASIGFSIYVQNFGSYNETFGSIAGVIVLLMWMWLSAYVVLLGAELNSEIEAQTARDTTTGAREPMGHRGAKKADELGAAS